MVSPLVLVVGKESLDSMIFPGSSSESVGCKETFPTLACGRKVVVGMVETVEARGPSTSTGNVCRCPLPSSSLMILLGQ